MGNLIPKDLLEQIPPLYATEDIAFGYVVSPFCSGELGYFSLNEIKSTKNSLGIRVERDLYFKPCKLSTIKKAS